jgi:DNA-binding transcriptional ArsR family regulator
VARAQGDADIARLAAAIGDGARARILLTLNDGRALPASMLASEAGVARSTASEHLRRLLDVGLVVDEQRGRHRYYRLAGPEVGALLESLSRLAPAFQVRSLKEGTRAEALRRSRTCYDHLAGRLGVAIFSSLLECGAVACTDRRDGEFDYVLTAPGHRKLGALGVELPPGGAEGTSPLRYCVDW